MYVSGWVKNLPTVWTFPIFPCDSFTPSLCGNRQKILPTQFVKLFLDSQIDNAGNENTLHLHQRYYKLCTRSPNHSAMFGDCSIIACANIVGDQFPLNDCYLLWVTFLVTRTPPQECLVATKNPAWYWHSLQAPAKNVNLIYRIDRDMKKKVKRYTGKIHI